MAEVLWGKVNPSGKLPVTIPWNVGQVPTIYSYRPMQYSRKFVWTHTGRLYPFGYGLSYTTYAYGEPVISCTEVPAAACKVDRFGQSEDNAVLAKVDFDLSNTGTVDGVEIVQLYVRDEYASVTRPVKELKDFKRVTLKAGETKRVSFDITSRMLACWGAEERWSVEPGDFTIMVGSSSADEDLKTVSLTVK